MAATESSTPPHSRVASWPRLPAYWRLREVSDVAIDSSDRVWVLHRGDHPVMAFGRDGDFITSWGDGLFRGPHGIYVGADDSVFIVDRYAHVVMKFSMSGELLLTLGENDHPSPTYDGLPFNMPTSVALTPSGDMYVADGYGNRRVHKFSPDGELVLSWGEPGRAAGQFALVHNLTLDRQGHVYVCDRENNRIQIFDSEGVFLAEWTDCRLPQDVYIASDGLAYVAEKGTTADLGARITVRDSKGTILSTWNEGLMRPHGIWVNSKGDVYVADLAGSVHMFAHGTERAVRP
jgi:sugar lactone lactonase YvrE